MRVYTHGRSSVSLCEYCVKLCVYTLETLCVCASFFCHIFHWNCQIPLDPDLWPLNLFHTSLLKQSWNNRASWLTSSLHRNSGHTGWRNFSLQYFLDKYFEGLWKILKDLIKITSWKQLKAYRSMSPPCWAFTIRVAGARNGPEYILEYAWMV